jgi:hypothetical protein
MGVVINEFEVLGEASQAPPAESGAAPERGADAAAGPPDPLEVQRVLRALMTQALRVWAH